jgi:two-component system, NtrC family, sensor histidine kinase HydH
MRCWVSQLAVVFLLSASVVVVAAIAGVSAPRLALLVVAAVVFALGYAITPAPGKCHYDARDLKPVLAMLVAVVAAIAVTGGIASPMLALLPAPLLVGWTMFGMSRQGLLICALVPVVLGGLVAMPAVGFTRADFALLAAWTTMLSIAIIARRIRYLFRSFSHTLGSLDRVRNGALSDVESRRRGLESMSTKLAHELKNPLAAIKSLIQLELRNITDEKSKRRLEVVFSESERMQTILRDYLSFDRPSDEMRVAKIDLANLMAEVETLLAGRAEAAGVALALHGRGGMLIGDARLLKEAIINIASNALEATPRGGTVDLSYRVGANGASIVVRDTGIGMSSEVSARVGTPFFTTRDGGTGLGVVLARSAIAQHRGTLEYKSTPGVGTIATIGLPRDPFDRTGAMP